MNRTQREAIEQAIGIEEDWLYRANMEMKRRGEDDTKTDGRMAYHARKLAELKEDL